MHITWRLHSIWPVAVKSAMFAANFVILACTTTLIITVVKSSLALSLGLVGALSIVRFRSAIKEPEELAYLFLTIAIGLGLGANQPKVTVAAFTLIVALICLGGIVRKPCLWIAMFCWLFGTYIVTIGLAFKGGGLGAVEDQVGHPGLSV